MNRHTGLSARLALLAIRTYQRWLSPYKGFSCALRAATGAASCSAYGHAVIARCGLRRGIGLLRRRTDLCGLAYRRIARAAVPLHPHLRRQAGFCDLPCDLPDLPCHGHAHCAAADTACDVADCVSQIGNCGSSRSRRSRLEARRGSVQLDALARRVKRRREQGTSARERERERR